MLNEKLIASYSQLSPPVVSAYLNTKPEEPSRHPAIPGRLTWLKNQTKSVSRSLPITEQEIFQKRVSRVQKFLEKRPPHERGLVIFAGSGTWKLMPLQVEVENELYWGKPSVSQLLRLLSEHKPHCIVVVDHTGARFFRYRLRELERIEEKKFEIDISQWKKKELGHVTGQKVQKTRGSQRDIFEYRMEAQYARLCRETANRAAELCKKGGLSAIFLAGLDRLIGPIEAGIPKEFRGRVVSVKEDLAQMPGLKLLQHLEPAIAAWERDYQRKLVSALVDADRAAVTGIDETLAQVQKGRVRCLVLAKDFDSTARQCMKCGWTDRSADPICSACGGERRAVSLRELLPELAKANDSEIEVVSGEAGEQLKEAGAMGAWLRKKNLAAAR